MDEYTNNIHARIDNILADAYFGAGSSPKKTLMSSSQNSSFDVSGLIWFIFGVIVGIIICYGVWYNSQSQDEDSTNSTA